MTKNLLRNDLVKPKLNDYITNPSKFKLKKQQSINDYDRPFLSQKSKNSNSISDSNSLFNNDRSQIYQLNLASLLKSNQLIKNNKKLNLRSKKTTNNDESTTSNTQLVKLSPKTERSVESNNYYEKNEQTTRSLIDVNVGRNSHKKLDDTKRIDQKRFKSNLYLSYLTYNSSDPFKSNYDFINKNNPEFYKKLTDQPTATLRFDRTNSSLSLVSQTLDYKKFLGHVELKQENLTQTTPPTTTITNADTDTNTLRAVGINQISNSSNTEIMDTADISAIFATGNNNNNNNNNNLNDKKSIDKPSISSKEELSLYELSKLLKGNTSNFLSSSTKNLKTLDLNNSNSNNNTKKSNLIQNQFLNYRNEKVSNKDNSLKASTIFNSTSNSNFAINNKKKEQPTSWPQIKNKENSSVSISNQNITNSKSDLLSEYRLKNGPEKFLDPTRLIYIKKWIDDVNKTQSNEGKFSETINKISFYD